MDRADDVMSSASACLHQSRLTVSPTQGQLGDYLGLAAAHVNRVLRALREDGVVTVRDGLVTIHSVELLAKRAYAPLDAYERTNPAYVGAGVAVARSSAQSA
jgi:hypothetical protein